MKKVDLNVKKVVVDVEKFNEQYSNWLEKNQTANNSKKAKMRKKIKRDCSNFIRDKIVVEAPSKLYKKEIALALLTNSKDCKIVERPEERFIFIGYNTGGGYIN